MQLIRGLTIIVVIYPLIAFMGISGAAIGVILSITGMLVVWYPLSQKITRASGYRYFNTFWPPLFCSLIMAGSIYVAKLYWNPGQQPLGLAILIFGSIVIMSICIYLASIYLLQRCYSKYDIFDEVKFFHKSLVRK